MGQQQLGYARFIVHKMRPFDSTYGHGCETLYHETFDSGFRGTRQMAPGDFCEEIVSDFLDQSEQVAEAVKDRPEGFYEVVGAVHYEFDPGDGWERDPDHWWWLEGVKVEPLTEEQAGLFYEAPVENQVPFDR